MNRWILTTGMTICSFLFLATAALAHCIWSEPPAHVDLNQPFTIKAFYADPDDPMEERDKTDLSFYVLPPGKSLQELELTEQSTYYTADTELNEPGQHIFILERVPNRYRLQEIRDFGKSVTWAGSRGDIVHDPVGIALEIAAASLQEQNDGQLDLTIQVLYDGNPVSEGEVEIFKSITPENALYEEIDEIDLDDSGKARLVLDPAYRYVLETDHHVPAGDVEGTGFAIREVRFRSTLCIPNR